MRNPKEEKEKKGKLKNPREHQLEASWAAGARRRLKATDGGKMRRGGGGEQRGKRSWVKVTRLVAADDQQRRVRRMEGAGMEPVPAAIELMHAGGLAAGSDRPDPD